MKAPYKISKIGAAHSQREAQAGKSIHDSEFKIYGFGDEIMLDPTEVTAGKWDHLEPRPVVATKVKGPKGKTEPVKEDEPEPVKEDDENISEDDLNKLIDQVEEADDAASLKVARQKVIDADLFEDGTVPKQKAALIQALTDLHTGG